MVADRPRWRVKAAYAQLEKTARLDVKIQSCGIHISSMSSRAISGRRRRAPIFETTVVVSPVFAQLKSAKKAISLINDAQDMLHLTIAVEDWANERKQGRRSLDVEMLAKEAVGKKASEPLVIVTGRPLTGGYFANESGNLFLISTAVEERRYPTRPLHLYIAYNLATCLPLFTLPRGQRLKLQNEIVHEDKPTGCFNDYCETIADVWTSMFGAHVCAACSADFVRGGIRSIYLEATRAIVARIGLLARTYDRRKRPDLFICHSFEDRRFSERLATDVKDAGFKAWFAELEMNVGDSLTEKIGKAINTSGLFAIVLSPDAVKSFWCRRELKEALERERSRRRVFVLPILYKKCRIPHFLGDKLRVDMGGKAYRRGLSMIIDRLREMEEYARAAK